MLSTVNNTVAVGIDLNQILDMKYIYKNVAIQCLKLNMNCPAIFTNQNLPLGIDYVWFRSEDNMHQVVVVSDRLNEQEACELILGEIKCGQHEYEKILDKSAELVNDFGDMTLLYLLGSGLAESLQVRCPVLMVERKVPENVSDTLKHSVGIAWNQEKRQGRTERISLYQENLMGRNEEERLLYVLATLSHEMRHVHQHENQTKKFFKNSSLNLSFEQYCMQPIELDAIAYAYCVLRDICGLSLFKIREYPAKVKSAVRTRAYKMHPLYSDNLRLLAGCFSDVREEDLIAV